MRNEREAPRSLPGSVERLGILGEIARQEQPLRFARALFTALQTRKLRGAADPQSQGRLAELHELLLGLAEGPTVAIRRRGPHLLVDRIRLRPTPDCRLAIRSLWQEMERLGAGGIEFSADLAPAALDQFLGLFPKLDRILRDGELADPRDVVPGVAILPVLPDAPADPGDPEARRAQARRTFFRALAAARGLVRQFSVHRLPELRKSRAVVHEMVDTMVEEEFSLLGLAAIQRFDPYTFQHSVHVSILSMALGQRLGLPRHELAALGVSAMFHDMGKTQVPKEVLQKPGRFDDQEWRVMRTHPLSGARELLRIGSVSDLLVHVMLVSAEHHLRFDGSGYPRLGDSWNQGLFARIVTLADCFDAMTASRIYMRRPFTPDAVVRYLSENTGRMFDPDLLRLFVGMVGLFPVGSVVRLESGEIGLVVEPPSSVKEVERPVVGLLEPDAHGWRLTANRALSEGTPVDPRCRIQAGCHPLDHGIDVDELLSTYHLEAA